MRIRAADVTLEGFDIDGRAGAISAGTPRASTSRRRAPSSATAGSTHALFGVYLREAHGARCAAAASAASAGKDAGREGLRHPRLEHRGLRVRRQRDRRRARRLLHPVVLEGEDPAQRRARPALRPALHVLGRQRVRGQPVRERRGRAPRSCTRSGSPSGATASSTTAASRRSGCCSRPATTCSPRTTSSPTTRAGSSWRAPTATCSAATWWRSRTSAIVLYDSSGQNRFEGNSFVANLTPAQPGGQAHRHGLRRQLLVRRTDEPDLDGDGRTDRPYRLSSVFDHVRGNLTAADLLADGFGARALGVAERTFPVLRAGRRCVDEAPLARPPALPRRAGAGRARARPRRGGSGALARVARPRRAGARGRGTASASGAAVISFRAFSKRFGSHTAVDSLSLEIGRGEAVALLGPNGSGKTTCLKAAAGLLRPSAGEVLLGEPPRPAARACEPRRPVVPASAGRVSRLAHGPRGGRVLSAACARCPGERTPAVLRFASLNGAGARLVGTYSGGMVQRLGLAVAAAA